MKRLIEFPLEDGSTTLIEVDDHEMIGVERVGRASDTIEKAGQTFEAALDKIRPAIRAVITKLREASPDQVAVEFSVKLSAKAGAFIASADTEAHLKVTLTWKKSEASSKQ